MTLLEKKKPKQLVWDTAQGIYADLTKWPKASYYCKCPKCGHVHGHYATFQEARAKRLCRVCHTKSIDKLKKEITKVDEPDKPKKPRARATVESICEAL